MQAEVVMPPTRAVRRTIRWAALVAAAATATIACSPPDEAVVAVQPRSGAVVEDPTGAAAGASGPDGEFGLAASDSSVAPAPPTLSPDAAAEGAVTVPSSTVAPTTQPTATAPPAPSTTPTTVTDAGEAPAEESSVPPSTAADVPITADVVQIEDGEAHSFAMLNDLRAELSLPALVRDPEMDAFAREWSRQMAESQLFEHSDGPYGENIAFTSNVELTAAEAADIFHQLWVDSAEHYANMSNERYTSSGIGLYLTSNGWYGTHVFKY